MNIKKAWLNIPHYIRVTILLTLANLGVLIFRNIWVGNHFYCFLKSNLYIGSLPTLVIAIVIKKYYLRMNTFFFWCITLLWVLFYPNAPYMISDLIHNNSDPVDHRDPSQVVFDTLIIFSIAMLSVYYGLLSIKIMFNVFRTKYNFWFAHTAIVITIILSCLGFYMGREMKSIMDLGNGYLYSWEIFLEPVQIFKAVWNLLFPLGSHIDAYLMMILFGLVQYFLLIIFKDIGDIEDTGPEGIFQNTVNIKNNSNENN